MNDDPKQQAIGLFEREWHSFDPWIRGLTGDQLDRPVFGEGVGWRVRDMITHIAWWQDMAGQAARKMASEGTVPGEGGIRGYVGLPAIPVAEQNALTDEEWRAVPIEARWERWHHAHSAMLDALRELRAEQLLDPEGPDGIRRWFAMPGFVHLRLHREHIEAALKESPTT